MNKVWNIVSNNIDLGYGVKSIVADSTSDLKTIPTATCKMGSTVFVIEDSSTYMLGGNRKWVSVTLPEDSTNGGNSGSGSGSDSGSSDGTSDSGSGDSGTSGETDYTVVDGGTAAG